MMRRASALRWWGACAEFCNEACIALAMILHVRDRLDYRCRWRKLNSSARLRRRSLAMLASPASGRRKGCSCPFDNGFWPGRRGFRSGRAAVLRRVRSRGREGPVPSCGSVDGFFLPALWRAGDTAAKATLSPEGVACHRRCRRVRALSFYFGGRYRGQGRRRCNFAGKLRRPDGIVGGSAFVADHHYVGQHRYFIAVVEKRPEPFRLPGLLLRKRLCPFIGRKGCLPTATVSPFSFSFRSGYDFLRTVPASA